MCVVVVVWKMTLMFPRPLSCACFASFLPQFCGPFNSRCFRAAHIYTRTVPSYNTTLKMLHLWRLLPDPETHPLAGGITDAFPFHASFANGATHQILERVVFAADTTFLNMGLHYAFLKPETLSTTLAYIRHLFTLDSRRSPHHRHVFRCCVSECMRVYESV